MKMTIKEAHEWLENKHRCNQKLKYCGGRCKECKLDYDTKKDDEEE